MKLVDFRFALFRNQEQNQQPCFMGKAIGAEASKICVGPCTADNDLIVGRVIRVFGSSLSFQQAAGLLAVSFRRTGPVYNRTRVSGSA